MAAHATHRGLVRPALAACGLAALLGPLAAPAVAQQLRLKDGRVLIGRILPVTRVLPRPDQSGQFQGETANRPIPRGDDEMRRVFISKLEAAKIDDQAPETLVKIFPGQSPADTARRLNSVGPAISITPWDQF